MKKLKLSNQSLHIHYNPETCRINVIDETLFCKTISGANRIVSRRNIRNIKHAEFQDRFGNRTVIHQA